MVAGEGVLVDLSVRGGRISSDTSLATGTDLELHLYLPDQEWPVEIAVAKVQWAAGTEFGVEFPQLSGKAAERVRRCVRALETGPSH